MKILLAPKFNMYLRVKSPGSKTLMHLMYKPKFLYTPEIIDLSQIERYAIN